MYYSMLTCHKLKSYLITADCIQAPLKLKLNLREFDLQVRGKIT